MTVRVEHVYEIFLSNVLQEDVAKGRIFATPEFWLRVYPPGVDFTKTEVFEPKKEGMGRLIDRLFDLSFQNYCIDHIDRVVYRDSNLVMAYELVISQNKFHTYNINERLIETLTDFDKQGETNEEMA